MKPSRLTDQLPLFHDDARDYIDALFTASSFPNSFTLHFSTIIRFSLFYSLSYFFHL